MIKGWLISNGSLKTPLFIEMLEHYQVAAKKLEIDLEIIFNNELVVGIDHDECFIKKKQIQGQPDFVLFLDKDIRLASQLERMGIKVFNSSKVIEICDDKAKTFQTLAGKGIKMPRTVIAPLMFYKTEEEEGYLAQVEELLGYPLVVKECFGSFGEQVYLVNDREELRQKREELMHRPHLYQQYITYSRGKDVRIYVVGDEVVACMLRTSSTDFRANINSGGIGQDFVPPISFTQMALKVKQALNADFLGIDILFESEQEPILCEVNSNAHIKAIEACCKVNIAERILAYIKNAIHC